MCYLGHWTKQKRLRFVLLRFFLSFSFLSLIGKGDSICGRMPLLILFSFFLYLFLKCTLEDSDEAGGGEGGPPLSLILTIVSICQCDGGRTRCVFLSAGQFRPIFDSRILSLSLNAFSIRVHADASICLLFFTNSFE